MIDLTNMEMRVALAVVDGKVCIDTETTGLGEDIHVEHARKLFNVEEVTPELRKKAKDAFFCWHYGGNPTKVVR